jgi:cell wall-active antibiotic response 4TMS protein YvqF
VLPLILIVAGVLALLMNFGIVSADQLIRALDLWPAALIVLGVIIIFRAWLPRLVVPVALLLTVLLMLGAFAYSTLLPATRVATAQSDYSAPLGRVEQGRLQIGLAGGQLTVQGQEISELYRARIEYPSGRAPEVKADGGTVSIQSRTDWSIFGARSANRARVSLNQSIPWEVEVGAGASRDQLELGSVHLTSLQISGGASQADVTLPRPSGTIAIRVSGGASNITVHRPRGVAARVQMSGGASNLTVDGDHRSVLGGGVSWTTSDYDSAADRYDFEISGGASNVTIDQR